MCDFWVVSQVIFTIHWTTVNTFYWWKSYNVDFSTLNWKTFIICWHLQIYKYLILREYSFLRSINPFTSAYKLLNVHSYHVVRKWKTVIKVCLISWCISVSLLYIKLLLMLCYASAINIDVCKYSDNNKKKYTRNWILGTGLGGPTRRNYMPCNWYSRSISYIVPDGISWYLIKLYQHLCLSFEVITLFNVQYILSTQIGN